MKRDFSSFNLDTQQGRCGVASLKSLGGQNV